MCIILAFNYFDLYLFLKIKNSVFQSFDFTFCENKIFRTLTFTGLLCIIDSGIDFNKFMIETEEIGGFLTFLELIDSLLMKIIFNFHLLQFFLVILFGFLEL